MTDHLFRGNEKGEILDDHGKVVGRIVLPQPTHYGTQFYAPFHDWSAHAVRVPERKPFYSDGYAEPTGWNAALDAMGIK